jgi:hypothetical protein
MKRVVMWIVEEKVTLMLLLLGVGIILHSFNSWVTLGGMVIYGVVIISLLTACHKLYLKFKQ